MHLPVGMQSCVYTRVNTIFIFSGSRLCSRLTCLRPSDDYTVAVMTATPVMLCALIAEDIGS